MKTYKVGRTVEEFASAHDYIPVGRANGRYEMTGLRADGTDYTVTIHPGYYYVVNDDLRRPRVLDVSLKPTAASATAMMKRYLRTRKASK